MSYHDDELDHAKYMSYLKKLLEKTLPEAPNREQIDPVLHTVRSIIGLRRAELKSLLDILA